MTTTNDLDFFVMLNTRGGITPLMEGDERIAMFPSEDAATACAKDNPLGGHFGFEVFRRGYGEHLG